MPPSDLQRLLSRLANDGDLRDLLATNPDAVLASYRLSPTAERQLRAGGPEALGLLSWAARGLSPPTAAAASPPQPDDPDHQEEAAETSTPLPPLQLLLQLSPILQPGPDGQTEIAHMAALLAPEAGQEAPEGALFVLHLAPLAVSAPDGRLRVHYTATIQPLGDAADPDGQPDTAVPTAPWGHDLTSPAVQAATRAVHDAPPEARHAAILALIQAVTAGG